MAPSYAERFVCIGGACEDTCCGGWTIPVDQTTVESYRHLPAGPLKTGLHQAVELKSPPSPHFAIIRLNGDRRCPLQDRSGLCQVHAQLGEQMLPETCRQYPRYKQILNGRTEQSLALSCPEATRLVLFTPDLLDAEGRGRALVSPGPTLEANSPLHAWAGPIRALVLWLVAGARQYPLWQRLFLLRLFCHRLDTLRTNQTEHTTPAMLAEFRQAVSSGQLRPALEHLPESNEAQMDLILQLAGLMLQHSNLGPRFLECVNSFTTGIGNGPGATLGSLAAGYEEARDHWFAPFLANHPRMLENWLINGILRHRFPFGWHSKEADAPTTAVEEFERLAANFALMRGLLIGVAGHHRERFSAAHVVHTVQSASKHFEHHPEFLPRAQALLVETGFNNSRGTALLLHEGVSRIPRPLAPAITDRPETATAL